MFYTQLISRGQKPIWLNTTVHMKHYSHNISLLESMTLACYLFMKYACHKINSISHRYFLEYNTAFHEILMYTNAGGWLTLLVKLNLLFIPPDYTDWQVAPTRVPKSTRLHKQDNKRIFQVQSIDVYHQIWTIYITSQIFRMRQWLYSTVKLVCNDHLYDKICYLWFIQLCVLVKTEGTNLPLLTISAFWGSSRWPLAT